MSILIKGMEMPGSGTYEVSIDNTNGKDKTVISLFVRGEGGLICCGVYELIPVPDHGQLLKVLKTERECVSRDCDRNCGKCDLSLEQSEILKAYNALIAMLDPTDKEGER